MWTNVVVEQNDPNQTSSSSKLPMSAQMTELSFSSKIDRLEHSILKNEWDCEAWISLLKESKDYLKFLKQFPTSTRHWLEYINTGKNIEQIFETCLQSGVDIRVWKLYIKYIQKQSDPETIQKGFEFCLGKVGQDKEAGPIYIAFISFIKTVQPKSPYEQQQQMDAIRKLFHKALSLPMTNIEEIWKLYDNFESQLSRLTAKKFISEKSAIYMNARLCLKELQKLMEPIERYGSYLPCPPNYTEKESLLMLYWKRVLEWEKSNALGLDELTHLERMEYVYENCLLMMRHFPSIWLDAYTFLKHKGRPVDTFIHAAASANPLSLSLTFACIEHDLKTLPFQQTALQFETLIGNLEDKISRLSAAFDREMTMLSSQWETVEVENDGETRQENRIIDKQHQAELSVIEAKKQDAILVWRKAITSAFIIQMRLARRQGEKQGRSVFSAARKSKFITPHVYLASAMIEYHCSKDVQIASRIFEFALKTFTDAQDIRDICLAYLDFLISINDDTNARAVFERVVATVSSEYAKNIWDKMMQYENMFGEQTVLQRLEKRRSEEYSDWNKYSTYYSFKQLNHVGDIELGLGKFEKYEQRIPKFTSAAVPTSKKDEKAPALESYHKELYVRPDTTFYTSVKQDDLKSMATVISAPASIQHMETPLNSIPAVVSWFLEKLGGSERYDGPPFKVDDILMAISKISDIRGGPSSSQFKKRKL